MATIMNIFEGRISRRSYFKKSVIAAVILLILMVLKSEGHMAVLYWAGTLLVDSYLFVYSVRRLHDLGHKGTLAILSYVPVANEILSLILWFKEGQVGENLYGPDPMMV